MEVVCETNRMMEKLNMENLNLKIALENFDFL